MNELARYDAMCCAIDACFELDEIKAIHDQVAALQAAARVANNDEAEMRLYQIRMRAQRRAGELCGKIEKAQGSRTDKLTSPGNVEKSVGKVVTLEKAGITTQQASQWERVADIPQADFETALVTRSVLGLIKKPADAPIPADDAGADVIRFPAKRSKVSFEDAWAAEIGAEKAYSAARAVTRDAARDRVRATETPAATKAAVVRAQERLDYSLSNHLENVCHQIDFIGHTPDLSTAIKRLIEGDCEHAVVRGAEALVRGGEIGTRIKAILAGAAGTKKEGVK